MKLNYARFSGNALNTESNFGASTSATVDSRELTVGAARDLTKH